MTSYAEQEQTQQPWLRRRRNVLIVDDNPTNRKLLREILQAERYTTVEAEDGLEALFTLEREPFDIVVCDILMPNMDGYSLCTEVRRRPEFNNLFFILYTSIDFTPDDEKRGLEVGADRFISKQGSPSMVLKSIEEGIGERRERRCEHAGRINEFPSMKEMKKYDALMIRQLEENSIELEQARDTLRNLNDLLEKRVAERTEQLEIANKELETFYNESELRVADRTNELVVKNAVLESRTEELARSNADLEQFAFAASHDLQEPLRVVAGCIQVFARKYRGGFDPRGQELLGMIVAGSARMKALIDGILAYTRAGQDQTLETIDTGAVLQDVLTNLNVAISESKAEVVFGALPSLRFVKGQFGQVLQNLVGNAIKYRSAVGPKIYVHAERQSAAWMFSIADNGIGFEQQYAEIIFGMFKRLHTSEEYLGSGIGLAIGKRIVERRGGRIWAESTPNCGSIFFFSIPDSLH
jgi:signal transduction histidine kinase/CheY-like chemotaxis protein